MRKKATIEEELEVEVEVEDSSEVSTIIEDEVQVQSAPKKKFKRKNVITPTVSPEEAPIFDLSKFHPTTSVSYSRNSSAPGAFTVVNSDAKGNGKRITMPLSVWEYLGSPDSIQVAITSRRIAIAKKIDSCGNNKYNIKEYQNKAISYAGSLVDELTKKYNLPFNPRTSITFRNIQYTRTPDYPSIIITIINKDKTPAYDL